MTWTTTEKTSKVFWNSPQLLILHVHNWFTTCLQFIHTFFTTSTLCSQVLYNIHNIITCSQHGHDLFPPWPRSGFINNLLIVDSWLVSSLNLFKNGSCFSKVGNNLFITLSWIVHYFFTIYYLLITFSPHVHIFLIHFSWV